MTGIITPGEIGLVLNGVDTRQPSLLGLIQLLASLDFKNIGLVDWSVATVDVNVTYLNPHCRYIAPPRCWDGTPCLL